MQKCGKTSVAGAVYVGTKGIWALELMRSEW